MEGRRVAGLVLAASVLTLCAGLRGDELLPGGIDWQTDLDTAHILSQATNRPMLVVFEADWCEHCSHLHATTLAHPQMVYYIGRRFVPVRLKVSEAQRAAGVFEVRSVPTSIVLSPQADLLGRAVGHVDAHRYHALLESCRRLQHRLQDPDAERKSAHWPEVDRARALGTRHGGRSAAILSRGPSRGPDARDSVLPAAGITSVRTAAPPERNSGHTVRIERDRRRGAEPRVHPAGY